MDKFDEKIEPLPLLTPSMKRVLDTDNENETPMSSDMSDFDHTEKSPLLRSLKRQRRTGDIITPHRAVLTLSKSMFNAGCFSLPYAWKLGGLWVSFVLQFVIAGLNWYGNHILVRASQRLATRTKRPALDYGHFTKKVCDHGDIDWLRPHSKKFMYFVNITILFYQLGMCSVAILFISRNLQMVVLTEWSLQFSLWICASISLVFVLGTNMFAELRVLSIFAVFSAIFFILGLIAILQHCFVQPNLWRELPASTNFRDTIMYVGMAMYTFEGQTMILPIENKLEYPDEFLRNCGVLPTTMMICTAFMTALGFYGYTAFGDHIASTITLNMPETGLYMIVNVFLMIQSLLGHSIAMYVVFDMFWNGFRRKFCNAFPSWWDHLFLLDKSFRTFWVVVTFLMAIAIPKLDILIPLVGVTSGTLCALVFPPALEMIISWNQWKQTRTKLAFTLKIIKKSSLISLGLFGVIAGVYANVIAIIEAFSGNPYGVETFTTSAAPRVP